MDVLRRNCDLCVIKKVSRKKQLPCSQHLSSPLLCRVGSQDTNLKFYYSLFSPHSFWLLYASKLVVTRTFTQPTQRPWAR